MNKVLFISVFLLVFLSSKGHAQKVELRPVAAFGSAYGGFANGITLGGNENNTEGKNRFQPSFAFGVGAQCLFSKHWSASLDLMYSGEGRNIRYLDDSYDFIDKANAGYLRVPLSIAYYFRNKDKKLRPYLITGVSLGILLNQDVLYAANNDYTNNYFSKEGTPNLEYKNIDFGLQLGLGAHYRLNKKSALFSEIKYYRGVVCPYEGGFLDVRNENVRVQIGYAYCLS